MRFAGYCDQWRLFPGERATFMVSTILPEYSTSMVRLVHGDASPGGPGFKVDAIASNAPARVIGRLQETHSGSFAFIPHTTPFNLATWTVHSWIRPTTVGSSGRQGILGAWNGNGSGFALRLTERGRIEVEVATDGISRVLSSRRSMTAGDWYSICFSVDHVRRHCSLRYKKVEARATVVAPQTETISAALAAPPLLTDAAWLFGAATAQASEGGRRLWAKETFDGRVANVALYRTDLSDLDFDEVSRESSPASRPEDVEALWDLGRDFGSTLITDLSGNERHGFLVNMPTRGVTSWNWTGDTHAFDLSPTEYAAVHFHRDDLEDAAWEPSFTIDLPSDLPSGVYAAELRANDQTEFLPFFVRPPRGTATASVAYLLPTFTYLAYANERFAENENVSFREADDGMTSYDRAVQAHPEWGSSLYDVHGDRSGVCYSSRLRPIPNLSPRYRFWISGAPRHLSADLYLVDWLETMDRAHDVITDEDLDQEGYDVLAPYPVVITGSHPEYWTSRMKDGIDKYVAGGGRLMYLGGNGFYWVTSTHKERPHVIEVRRGQAATRTWESAPGENYLSTTGELGGLWRHRGRAPNRLVGVGFVAQGSGPCPGYDRLPDSHNSRVAFIFDGIGREEEIGAFGLIAGGAAGDEIDSGHQAQGPSHMLILATSSGKHTDRYALAHEEIFVSGPDVFGTKNRDIRSDIVFFETPSGGAVFSVGSINWMGSLSHNHYRNNVSRMTNNVLERFLDPEPFRMPTETDVRPTDA